MILYQINNAIEAHLIDQIARRAVEMYAKYNDKPPSLIDMVSDIRSVHLNGCPLDLKILFDASDFKFAHDIFGIRQHLDRQTGKLDRRFLPRCAK